MQENRAPTTAGSGPPPAPRLPRLWRRVRLPLGLFLLGFCVVALLLALSVQRLRGDVATIVSTLRRVDALHQDLRGTSGTDLDLEPALQEIGALERVLGELGSADGAAPLSLLRTLRVDLEALGRGAAHGRGAALTDLETLENVLRAETGALSAQLGARWNVLLVILSLSLLAGLGVFALTEALVRERERAAELRQRASTDPLTGLPNRAGILEVAERELTRAARESTACGVLLVDLDGFKHVNDRFGHPVGDEVLRHAAQRLRGALRPYDSVGRYGGDEFLVLIPRCDEAQLRSVAERLRGCLEPAIESVRGAHPLSLSVGGVCSAGGAQVEELVHVADRALYRAKRSGRNGWVLENQPDRGPAAAPDPRLGRGRP